MSEIPNPPRARILIVDDEEDIREGLETLLLLENYRVDQAATANEGLAMLDVTSYDLVLLDLMLPDKSGIDFLQDAWRQSGFANHHDRIQWMSVGAQCSALDWA